LFLGSIGAAQNEARLIELGITHVLCVGRDIAPPSNLNQRVISIQDSGTEQLGPHISECIEFMQQAIEPGGGVLVHCFAGKSRSTSMVIAYLMVSQGMQYLSAFDLVREKRPSVNPNAGFCTQLRDLGIQLALNTGGAGAEASEGAPRPTALKSVSNRLLSMIRGCGGSTSVIVAEDDQFVVVHQKFGVSKLHLTMVPTLPIPSLVGLDGSHVEMLRVGLARSMQVIEERTEGKQQGEVRAGFVFPQAVEQVQLHVIAPPFQHERLFAPPRWHSFDDVIRALECDGHIVVDE